LVLGLIIYYNTNNNPERNHNSSLTETSLIRSSAAPYCGTNLQAFQKNQISTRENFKFLSPVVNQFLENKKTDQKILILQNIQKITETNSTSFFQYHIFPTERDELPLLS
jgi:hypothetical protein